MKKIESDMQQQAVALGANASAARELIARNASSGRSLPVTARASSRGRRRAPIPTPERIAGTKPARAIARTRCARSWKRIAGR